MRLVTLGVGAAASPRYAAAGLLVARCGVRVMLDGGPGAEPAGRLDAWLVTDERAELRSQLRRLAAERGLCPHAGSFQRGELRIDARPVVHTSHPTFGYLIEAPEGTVVWAPEFFEFPRWAHGAGLMFAEAAGWERPIRFVGGVGGHLHVPVVAERLAVTGSAAWCSPISGGPRSGRSTAGSGPPSGSSPGTARCP
jgi:hypothetical protein